MFEYLIQKPIILYTLIVWVLFWKGMSLWKAARNGEKGWFIALLVINTFGILEICYIYLLPVIKNKMTNKKEETNIVSS